MIFFLIALTAYILYRINFWIREGNKLQIPGYLPPAPSLFGRVLLKLISRIGCYLFVGRINVIGKENISFNQRLLIVSNHSFALDFMVLNFALPYSFRHLAKAEEVQGWRAPVAACTGHFAVDVANGRAKPGFGALAVEACARVLRNDRLLIFPQGKIVVENKLTADDFRTGAMRTAQLVLEKLQCASITIQPIAIQYQRNSTQAACLSQFAAKIGLRKFEGLTNFGAVVTIGKQIVMNAVPKDLKQATQELRLEIQNLLDEGNVKRASQLY
jgi:1-acyl-sn-glycerol-3-phosphate acyltransferase